MAAKRAHPALVGVAVFTAVTAAGLGLMVFNDSDDAPEEVIELPEGFDYSNSDTPVPPVAPDGTGSPDATTGSQPAPQPTTPDDTAVTGPTDSVVVTLDPGVTSPDDVSPDAVAPGTPTGTDPEFPGEPDDGQGDPGDPVVRAPERALEAGAVQSGNSSVWIYGTLLTTEELVAHYVGALNSDPWTFVEIVEEYLEGGSSDSPDRWMLTATSPTADAEVFVFVNSQGVVSSQVEVVTR